MTRKLAVAALALTLLGAGAQAAGPDLIEARQAGQDLVNGDFAGIRAVVTLKGDVKTLQKPAEAIARWMKLFPSMFPPGSDKGGNTKALPAVWTDTAGFQKDADALVQAATALATAAKADDAAAVAAQIKAMGDACSACHKAFRAR
ncbi:MAG TPA: cytochrome c [Acetobacteraceae bacterium]|nr:cytochrome c [Acetobacteraceae bacterium]